MEHALGARSVGARVKRIEDPRILTGQGLYVDDVKVPGALHAVFFRSQVPHGRLVSLDVSEARALPGVVAVYTGADLAAITTPAQAGSVLGLNHMPGIQLPVVHALVTDKVRFVGDPIAVVVAENRYIAEDALELIVEEIEPLDPIVTYDDALDASKPKLFEELPDNVNLRAQLPVGDIDAAFAKADRVVRGTVDVHRHQCVPMETRGLVVDWDAKTEQMTIWASTQSPHMYRMMLPMQIGVPTENIRVLAYDVGGGFGLKNAIAREDVAITAIAKDLGRPVKWIEDRLEHLVAAGHAREEKVDYEAAVTDDGRILGLKMDVKVNIGAYPCDPFPGSMMAFAIVSLVQGPLKLEAFSGTAVALFTNKASYVAYRGPWATADFLRERMVDTVAHELGLDPIEVRRRNYVVNGEPPTHMLTGKPFLGVTTQDALEQAVRLVGWSGFRARQEAARAEGRFLGIGMSCYLEGSPGPRVPGHEGPPNDPLGAETTRMALRDDGKVLVYTRQQPHGQSHQTTLTQVASDEFGVPFDQIEIVWGDTSVTPVALIGTGGSRAATMASGAVLHASRELRDKVLAAAADQLEAAVEDVEMVDGRLSVRGTPAVSLSLADLAARVGEELTVTHDYDGGVGGWSGGAHVAIVEVDTDTGLVTIERYVVVEDCGEPINPAVVEGQVRGGVVQGIGAVLLEHAAYDADGQYLAASFMDYLMPIASLVPNVEVHHVETIRTDPDVNFRGVGEGGMVASPAAIVNAIEDALAPFGARITEQHLPPARILALAGKVPS